MGYLVTASWQLAATKDLKKHVPSSLPSVIMVN